MFKERNIIAVLAGCLIVVTAGLSAKGISNQIKIAEESKQIEITVTQDFSDNLQQAEGPVETKEIVEIKESQIEPQKPEIIEYTVKAGDTLGQISQDYEVSIKTISMSNDISESSIINEGQKLRFPSISGILYTIKSGETLWDLSLSYSVDIKDILNANALETEDKLKVGQEIIIPGGDKAIIQKSQVNNQKSNSGTITSNSKQSKTSGIKVASRGKGTTITNDVSITGIIWPVSGKVTSVFGPRWGEFHEGIDIAAPIGTDIKAALDGKVVYSGWMSGFGYIVKLNHGNGFETYYGHNSKNLVNEGEYVSKGQIIAKLGNTGRSTGPHIEFGIRENGTPINPLKYLK